MRTRFLLVVSGVALVLVLTASAASAWCPAQPLKQLMSSSDAVWWGTVTDASAAPGGRQGVWQLTVHLDDVLKGPGAAGDSATVFTWSCGPMISRAQAASSAPGFIGQQGLFFGSLYNSGALDDYSGIATPQVKTSDEQYHLALADLGLKGPRDAPRPAFAGTLSEDSTPWLGYGFIGLAFAFTLVATIVVLLRKRSN